MKFKFLTRYRTVVKFLKVSTSATEIMLDKNEIESYIIFAAIEAKNMVQL